METIKGLDRYLTQTPEEYFGMSEEEYYGAEEESHYIGVNKNAGIDIAKEDAFMYALEKLQSDKDLQEEYVEWFYSGDWLEKGGK